MFRERFKDVIHLLDRVNHQKWIINSDLVALDRPRPFKRL